MDIFSHFVFIIALILPILSMDESEDIWKILFVVVSFSLVVFFIIAMSIPFLIWSGALACSAMVYFFYKSLENRRYFFVFSAIVGAVAVSSLSHVVDYMVIALPISIPPMDSPFRPQNLWHTISFSILLTGLTALLLPKLHRHFSSKFNYKKYEFGFISVFSSILLGYLSHIFADSITYDFDVWWAFPFSDIHFSLYDLADSGLLLMESNANPWNWVYYYLNVPLLLFALSYLILIVLIKKEKCFN